MLFSGINSRLHCLRDKRVSVLTLVASESGGCTLPTPTEPLRVLAVVLELGGELATIKTDLTPNRDLLLDSII